MRRTSETTYDYGRICSPAACLPALTLCNRSFPSPVARVCKPLLWLELRIAMNQGPKGRQNWPGVSVLTNPRNPSPRNQSPGRGDRGQPMGRGKLSVAPSGLDSSINRLPGVPFGHPPVRGPKGRLCAAGPAVLFDPVNSSATLLRHIHPC